MREVSAIELLAELDKDLPKEGLIVLLGEDNYLKEQIIKKITDKIFSSNTNTLDLIKLSPPFNINDYLNAITTPPFFQKKLIVIKDGESLSKQTIQKIISFRVEEFAKVILSINEKDMQLFQGDLIVVKDYTVPLNQVEKWIEKKAKEFNKTITKEAILELIRRLDTNFYALSTEIKKLQAFIQDRKEIRKEDVEAIVKEIPEEDIFEFVNAVILSKRSEAINMLEYFLRSTNQENIVLSQILKTLSIYLIVYDLKNKEGENLKSINEYISNIFGTYLRRQTLENIVRNLDKMDIKSIVKHYNTLVEIDAKSKRGEVELPFALRNYILTKIS